MTPFHPNAQDHAAIEAILFERMCLLTRKANRA